MNERLSALTAWHIAPLAHVERSASQGMFWEREFESPEGWALRARLLQANGNAATGQPPLAAAAAGHCQCHGNAAWTARGRCTAAGPQAEPDAVRAQAEGAAYTLVPPQQPPFSRNTGCWSCGARRERAKPTGPGLEGESTDRQLGTPWPRGKRDRDIFGAPRHCEAASRLHRTFPRGAEPGRQAERADPATKD